jgi:hypothetical protein
MLESEQTLIPAFARGPVPVCQASKRSVGWRRRRRTAPAAVRVPAVKHTPSPLPVTRHPAGSRAFRIAEHLSGSPEARIGSHVWGVLTAASSPSAGTASAGAPRTRQQISERKTTTRPMGEGTVAPRRSGGQPWSEPVESLSAGAMPRATENVRAFIPRKTSRRPSTRGVTPPERRQYY